MPEEEHEHTLEECYGIGFRLQCPYDLRREIMASIEIMESIEIMASIKEHQRK